MADKLVSVSDALSPKTRIWRYVSFDKLIDMLATESLYMSSVMDLAQTDPCEGQDHPQMTQLWATIVSPVYEDIKQVCGSIGHISAKDIVSDLIETIDASAAKLKRSVRVSCWQANERESEGMWRLYGDSKKTIAVVSSVAALASSIRLQGIDEVLDLVPVRYLDYNCSYPHSELRDFRGRITVTKRLEFQHENEVRLTMRPLPSDPREWLRTNFELPIPFRLPVDIQQLIHEIRISPYAVPPPASSVEIVCRLLGTDVPVRTSMLLDYKGPTISQFL